ncbi:MAG TPA: SbcC/MukB-like Walker B domain-containing protein, partial [Xanthomonadales bacterium]|nr:SbcC/MukB-like Walker B domain-containing protein [Xanthomonadales bacterium]
AALLASARAQSEELRCAGQLAATTHQQQALQAQLLDRLAEMAPQLELQQPTLADLQTLLASCPADLAQRLADAEQLQRAWLDLCAQVDAIRAEIEHWRQQAGSARTPDDISAALALAEAAHSQAQRELGALQADLRADDLRRLHHIEQRALLASQRAAAQRWALLDDLIGARDGAKFKRYAQQFTLEVLIEYANEHLAHLARRYRLRRGTEALSLLVIDGDLADEVRSVHSLSGGETFLVSLALALGLASLSAQRLRVESLFIDEGFGSLDADTLNTAMEALDRLQAQGRRIGVISHVHDMAERIGVQVRVETLGAGRSRVVVIGQG